MCGCQCGVSVCQCGVSVCQCGVCACLCVRECGVVYVSLSVCVSVSVWCVSVCVSV